jgi:hypothetical protein
MINSNRKSILGALFGLGLLVSPLMAHASAQAASSSSYQSSCKDIKISDGDLLSAKCRTQAGKYKQSSVRIQGIQNKDGKLIFTSLDVGSSYPKTCKKVNISGATLTAKCKKINRDYVKAAILIPGIKNINGDLTY